MKYQLLLISTFVISVLSQVENGLFKDNREIVNINGSNYFFSAITAKFSDAVKQCNDLGLKLLSIQSQEKQIMIADYVDNNGHENKYLFTGGKRESDFSFVWSGTGEVFDYTNWYTEGAEPDDPVTSVDVCVRLLTKSNSHQWEDLSCAISSYYICEELK